MKLILKNSELKFQQAQWTVVDKTYTNAPSYIILPFTELRSASKLSVQVEILDKSTWSKETFTYRFGRGASDTVGNMIDYIYSMGAFDIIANNDEISAIQKYTIDFSNTSTYPDTQSLKITPIGANYTENQILKTVKYRVKYIIS